MSYIIKEHFSSLPNIAVKWLTLLSNITISAKWYLKIQFIPHRKCTASPLLRQLINAVREIIFVPYRIYTACGQNAEISNVKTGGTYSNLKRYNLSPAILAEFLSHYRQCQDRTLKWATVAFFCILSNSLFTDHLMLYNLSDLMHC